MHYAVEKKHERRRLSKSSLTPGFGISSNNTKFHKGFANKLAGKYMEWRQAIFVQERLSVTFSILRTGDFLTTLQYLSKMLKKPISTIIPAEVFESLGDGLESDIQVRRFIY
ncbi:hypothetical protein JTB14_032876 [Gonioctena quinquepunctata]|nr:hypothetical protein JTB14_032876 [Gonioctena quinquepunctata]